MAPVDETELMGVAGGLGEAVTLRNMRSVMALHGERHWLWLGGLWFRPRRDLSCKQQPRDGFYGARRQSMKSGLLSEVATSHHHSSLLGRPQDTTKAVQQSFMSEERRQVLHVKSSRECFVAATDSPKGTKPSKRMTPSLFLFDFTVNRIGHMRLPRPYVREDVMHSEDRLND
ncbi:hypothetical protein HPB50_001741 [Hyalomma asiaticum]|uniref:Uncharacterized protein n=1 Tax=Hyalomma asiaticum TaxID=266040 RepID=A0ACB7T9U3_HYAAI|nr:hypothetical protein HPB50_001741 [Hyalomma asiaticum]